MAGKRPIDTVSYNESGKVVGKRQNIKKFPRPHYMLIMERNSQGALEFCLPAPQRVPTCEQGGVEEPPVLRVGGRSVGEEERSQDEPEALAGGYT